MDMILSAAMIAVVRREKVIHATGNVHQALYGAFSSTSLLKNALANQGVGTGKLSFSVTQPKTSFQQHRYAQDYIDLAYRCELGHSLGV